MEFIEFSDRRIRTISADDIRNFQKPVMLYLGCLHHVQGIDINKTSFFDYMDQLRGPADAHIIMPINRDTSFDELMAIRRDYNDGLLKPTPLAQYTYVMTYKALVDACDFQNLTSVQELKSKLSRISIFGYSYGTSLEQQVAEAMAHDLSKRLGEIENKGLVIFDICQSVKATNIGPVARLHQIDADGSVRLLRYDDPHFNSAKTLFSQISFLMSEDRIAYRSYQNEALGRVFASATGIELRETSASALLIDYTKTPMRRALGYQEDRIVNLHIQDPTNHNPRLYTNTHERLGSLKVFPSLAISPVFRSALVSMLQSDLEGPDWLKSIRDPLADPIERVTLVKAFNAATCEFDFVTRELEMMDEDKKVEFLKTYVEDPAIQQMSYFLH